MASRTCPHCNHQYSIGEHYKNTLLSSSFKRWNCSNCGSRITINFIRRMLLTVCGGLLMASMAFLIHPIVNSVSFQHLLILFSIPSFLLVFSFDDYSKVDN